MLVFWSRELTPEFEETNYKENLPLGSVRDGVPKGRGVGLSGEGGSVHLHGPWELDTVGVDNVSYESKHGNTSVLDLRVTKETDGGFIRSSPEFGLGEVEGVIESNNRVELLGKSLKVSLIFS